MEEVRRRLHEAVSSYSETKQIRDALSEVGQITEGQMNAAEAENKTLTNTLKKFYTQQLHQASQQ